MRRSLATREGGAVDDDALECAAPGSRVRRHVKLWHHLTRAIAFAGESMGKEKEREKERESEVLLLPT